jgi:hypothetical protein
MSQNIETKQGWKKGKMKESKYRDKTRVKKGENEGVIKKLNRKRGKVKWQSIYYEIFSTQNIF